MHEFNIISRDYSEVLFVYVHVFHALKNCQFVLHKNGLGCLLMHIYLLGLKPCAVRQSLPDFPLGLPSEYVVVQNNGHL